MADTYRTERDSLGEMKVPAEARYGPQTQRAVENFPISGQRFSRRFIQAMGLIKKSAAETNVELGNLDEEIEAAMESVGTTYFNDDAEIAKELTRDCVAKYEELLTKSITALTGR